MKFTAVVGNPPYQEQKGGTKNIDIWPHFVFFANNIADNVAIIHPGRWVIPKKQMSKVRDEIVNSGLKMFDYYPDATKLFQTVAIDGGVTITIFQKNYKGKIKYSIEGKPYGYYEKNVRFLSNPFEEEILKCLSSLFISNKTMQDRILGNIGSLGGSEYGYSKTEHIGKLHKSPEKLPKPIKIWANSSKGKGTRFSWYFIDESTLNNIPKNVIATRKVMIDKKGHSIAGKSGNIFNNNPLIVDKKVIASGDVLFVIPEHDTDYDLKLIKSLFMTKTVRFLMSITQKDLYVRGFDNIPDYTLFIQKLNGGGCFLISGFIKITNLAMGSYSILNLL